MKIYLQANVFDAALARIRWLFDEFPEVTVAFSGGKDSTVIFNLALIVAREKGRLPLSVFFIDQEAEWQTVIDYIRTTMNRPEVNPLWLQVPYRYTHATSNAHQYFYPWEPGKQWIRAKEPNSIHDNTFGTDRFAALFGGYLKTRHHGEKVCYLAGVRAEESPTRLASLMRGNVYRGVTWGKQEDEKQHFVFYPIYDWSYTDVWKAIHDHGWAYCSLYDVMYQHGIPTLKMRVSSINHETSVSSLTYLQEVEGQTWNAVTARLEGVNAVNQMQGSWFAPKDLPPMFADWREYRDHLLENLVTKPDIRARFRKQFDAGEQAIAPLYHPELWKHQVACIIVDDFEGTKLPKWILGHYRWKRGGQPGDWSYEKQKREYDARKAARVAAEAT